MIMAYGYYKLFYGIREQKYVSANLTSHGNYV